MTTMFAKRDEAVVPSLPIEQQPEMRELAPKVHAARVALEAAEKQYHWAENLCDPHRRRWRETAVAPDEEMSARLQRQNIHATLLRCQKEFAEEAEHLKALVFRLEQDIVAARRGQHLALIRDLADALQAAVEANAALREYEYETEQLTHKELPVRFYWPLLTDEKLGEWESITQRELRQ